MNNNLHQEEYLLDNLKNPRSNEMSSIPNLSFDPYLLCELNARYLHDMNALDPINENVISRFVRNKHDDILKPIIVKSSKLKMNLSSNLSKKCNKWCTAHIRICWMIYHQQQQLNLKLLNKKKDEEEQSSLNNNNKLPDLISNIPFLSNDLSTFKYQSSFDVCNNSFVGLANVSIPPLNVNSSRFHRNIESFSPIIFDEINRKYLSSSINRNSYNHLTNPNCLLSLSRKFSSDNLKSSSNSVPSIFSTFDPLTLSIIERQRLSTAYALQEKNKFSTNIDPLLFLNNNNNSSSLYPNLESSPMTSALIQREHFINLLRLSQQQHEHRGIKDSNPVQINKSLKTKFEQLSPINKEKTKKIKLENSSSPTSNCSTSSSIKSKDVKGDK